jgi:hypothetical protein
MARLLHLSFLAVMAWARLRPSGLLSTNSAQGIEWLRLVYQNQLMSLKAMMPRLRC